MNLTADRSRKAESVQKKEFSLSVVKSGLQGVKGKNAGSEECGECEEVAGRGAKGGAKSVAKKKTPVQPNVTPAIRLQTFKDKAQFESCIASLGMIDMSRMKGRGELVDNSGLLKEIIRRLSNKYLAEKVLLQLML